MPTLLLCLISFVTHIKIQANLLKMWGIPRFKCKTDFRHISGNCNGCW